MCELCQPTPVLNALSREKGYPTGELSLLPPAAQGRMAGVSHTGGSAPPKPHQAQSRELLLQPLQVLQHLQLLQHLQVLQSQLPLSCSTPRVLPRAGTAVCPSVFPLSNHPKLQRAALFSFNNGFHSPTPLSCCPQMCPSSDPVFPVWPQLPACVLWGSLIKGILRV